MVLFWQVISNPISIGGLRLVGIRNNKRQGAFWTQNQKKLLDQELITDYV